MHVFLAIWHVFLLGFKIKRNNTRQARSWFSISGGGGTAEKFSRGD
jgi:hypothetical protein